MNLATIQAIINLLKQAGLLPDREAEDRAREALRYASGQFLLSTSGPIYALARIAVIAASLWDVFINSGRAWAATGMNPHLELIPVLWLFLGPEIVVPAVGALGQAFARGAETRPSAPRSSPRPPYPPGTGITKDLPEGR